MDMYYLLTGFENQIPFTIRFTYIDISLNRGEHKDTEIFYSLAELHSNDISELPMYHNPIVVRVNRDDESSVALLQRVSQHKYEKYGKQ